MLPGSLNKIQKGGLIRIDYSSSLKDLGTNPVVPSLVMTSVWDPDAFLAHIALYVSLFLLYVFLIILLMVSVLLNQGLSLKK